MEILLDVRTALASLEFLINNKILQKTVEDGEYFRSKLEWLKTRHPTVIREVRGKGLMLAAELKNPGEGCDHEGIRTQPDLALCRTEHHKIPVSSGDH